jgi:low affinity Fe/Cu permease
MIERQNFRRRRYRGRRRDDNGRPRQTYEKEMQFARQATASGSQKSNSKLNDAFHSFSRKTSTVMGSPWAFAAAIVIIIGWAFLGPMFGFSDTWQLVINTATTIVTFLMVFLIQNTQNRDARAIHLKLDELLHGVKGARNRLINLEDLSEEDLDQLQREFEKVRKIAPRERCEEKEQDKE